MTSAGFNVLSQLSSRGASRGVSFGAELNKFKVPVKIDPRLVSISTCVIHES